MSCETLKTFCQTTNKKLHSKPKPATGIVIRYSLRSSVSRKCKHFEKESIDGIFTALVISQNLKLEVVECIRKARLI